MVTKGANLYKKPTVPKRPENNIKSTDNIKPETKATQIICKDNGTNHHNIQGSQAKTTKALLSRWICYLRE